VLNETTVIRHIRMRLGLSHNVSPVDDEKILEVVKQESLYTFSKYYPYMFTVNIYESKDQLELQRGIYYMETADLEVLGISKIFRTSHYLYDKWPIYNIDAFNYQMYSDMASMVSVPSTYLFRPPNKVEVYPKFYTPADFMIEVKCIHPEHFMTVPLNLRDQFLELAVLDARVAIWQILKNYGNINTAFGSLSLNLDDYQNAMDEKRTLLEKWDEKFYMEPNRKKIFIA
jgi:hypothetical protein